MTRWEREMIYSVLPEEVELSGGIDAAPMYLANPDLNAASLDDAIIFVKSGPYRGSGGVCNFWIFERTASGWTQINDDHDAVAQALEVLPTSTVGCRDIRIHGVCGGNGSLSDPPRRRTPPVKLALLHHVLGHNPIQTLRRGLRSASADAPNSRRGPRFSFRQRRTSLDSSIVQRTPKIH